MRAYIVLIFLLLVDISKQNGQLFSDHMLFGGDQNVTNKILKGFGMNEKDLEEKVDAIKAKKAHLGKKDGEIFNSSVVEEKLTTYSCYKCYFANCGNYFTNCTDAARCFSSTRRNLTGHISYSRGCIRHADQVPFLCKSSYRGRQEESFNIKCCSGNFCNNFTLSIDENFFSETILLTTLILSFIFLLIIIIFAVFYINKQFNMKKLGYVTRLASLGSYTPPSSSYRDDIKVTTPVDSTIREFFTESVTSGSGSGLPFFVQRTLAKNIFLEEIVGKGRYGEVWKGVWQGDTVAVKIFFSKDDASWRRETEIYSTVLLRHENILGFYGSDVTSRASCTQMWLVAHYHPNGSLFDYLNANTLNHRSLIRILLSSINGLMHLHTEIGGTLGKPSIAHRDVKSKNILVKNDGSCCIADLGLAVLRNSVTGEVNIGTNARAGTKRYMSPEVLNETIEETNFDSFRQVDIYSMALVIWECCRRCEAPADAVAEDYELPFQDLVPSDPSFDDMKKIVFVEKCRPVIPERWSEDKVLREVSSLLHECWHHNPNVRLTALRIKKNILKIHCEKPSKIQEFECSDGCPY